MQKWSRDDENDEGEEKGPFVRGKKRGGYGGDIRTTIWMESVK